MLRDGILKNGKRLLFTIFTQGLLSVAAIIMGFGMPKLLPIEEYSRWQVFYFYVGYINYLQFGFNDGLILNYSGQKFEKLPWSNIKRATIKIILYQALGVGILIVAASHVKCDFAVVELLLLSCVPTVLMCILSAVLLAGNKTYDYNLFCLIIRLVFVAIMIIGICLSITDAEFYMLADIASKILVILAFYAYERRFIPKIVQEDLPDKEKFITKNCASGIIIASTVLLLGLLPMCGRVVIQLLGSEVEYAMFSFAISMLSIILTFTNAIGTVAFPMLKNVDDSKGTARHYALKKLYDEVLWICLWAIVIINFVVYSFLNEYRGVLEYFPILLAVCWPLGKIQSLIYPFYKVYRKEKDFLKICLIGITITFGLSFLMYPLAKLTGLAMAALLGVMITYLLLDVFFEKKVVQGRYKLDWGAYVMLGIFLSTSLLLSNGKFAIIYGVSLAVHIYFVVRKIYKIHNG